MSPRSGTKIAEVIVLLQRADGATLAELVAATGWLPHTARAALTGLRKRGYDVRLMRKDRKTAAAYRVTAPAAMASR
jgi:DNA-binding IclR family transcriptional regulator